MLIRSQNKRNLIETKELNIEILTVDKDYYTNTNTYIIKALSDKYPRYLGEYSTEEKAMKVLDMIEDTYLEANYYGYGCHIQNVVFVMPQDEEVDEDMD